jgi:uncharacterized protein (UPF0261 family)/ABC-type branched-subunit amino acid transport system ATPase component
MCSASISAVRMVEAPALAVDDLHVYYGHSHALQGVSLTLARGVLAVVGRNGMGKSTLCNAIAGLVPAAAGAIRVRGHAVQGLAPNRIARLGVGYVPQGRRVWRSLTVDEHLRLVARGGAGARWTVERIYETFPRLAERRRNGGNQLSGGEQQMLAIGRALLGNPRLLVMDEPTEGLAPVIVAQVEALLQRLATEEDLSVLLIEQNLGVATEVADRIAIMVNGRIAGEMEPAVLAADEGLQQRLLGVGRHAEPAAELAAETAETAEEVPRIFALVRRGESAEPPVLELATAPTRFTADGAGRALPQPLSAGGGGFSASSPHPWQEGSEGRGDAFPEPPPLPTIAEMTNRRAYVAGTFDTKGRELLFIRHRLQQAGIPVVTVDLATSRRPSAADISPTEVARHHPRGPGAVFGADRGASVTAMAEAFERFIATRRDVGGIISAGGSGGTALATPAMRRLPVGVPKVMVSTVASGDVKRYVGPADICMMYSVTDVQGINRISEQVLGNAAHALAGMMAHAARAGRARAESKPAVGLTMFGVTTPCVQMVQKALEEHYDCLVFHATGTGGQSFEKLADSGLLAGAIDVTTTEVADLLVGGVFSAGEDRLGAFARRRLPYVGSCGALDMVNFHALDTVPPQFRARRLHVHNANVTLMRTTAEECAAIGRWIGERLNRMEGRVRFLIPEGGVSLLDAPGQPFYDPEADRALFAALAASVRQNANRRLIRLPYNINDPAFAAALVENFQQIAG